MIVICGAGALGSQIAMHIALPRFTYQIWDDDRVEEHNIATSAYMMHHVGMRKATILSEMMYRKCGAIGVAIHKTVPPFELHHNATLLVDTFDNVGARAVTCGLPVPTLHVGVSEDRTGMIFWDEDYVLPEPEYARGENPVCTHELGRDIIRFTAAVAAGVISRFRETGEKISFVVTESMEVLR